MVGPSVVEEERHEQEDKPVRFADAPSSVRAVLNRPWPAPKVIAPSSPFGKYRTLVATADTIGDPISEEEFAALEDKEGDDMCIRLYKQSARTNAHMQNYIHEHGCLYMDESDGYIFDNSVLVEEIRCKHVPVEEMEANATRGGSKSTYLSEVALTRYNNRSKVKFELCEKLLCRSFWEQRGFFWHLNFIAKHKG